MNGNAPQWTPPRRPGRVVAGGSLATASVRAGSPAVPHVPDASQPRWQVAAQRGVDLLDALPHSRPVLADAGRGKGGPKAYPAGTRSALAAAKEARTIGERGGAAV